MQKKLLKIIFGALREKNDLNMPEKLEETDKKIKRLFKLPRIDMEMSGLGKNCKKSLKKSPKICLFNVKKEQKFRKNDLEQVSDVKGLLHR